jgi:hypothetical protein
MRLLPIAALVLASLIFSVGGVAIVGRADSSAESSGQSPAPAKAATAAQPAQPQQCATPKPFDGRIQARHVAVANDSIPLNTRGYNYAYPGEIQMDPTGRTNPGDAQAPKAQPATPPAAPAKP